MKLITVEDRPGAYILWCPGCECGHLFPTGPGEKPRWTFNGNLAKPTFTPSMLIKGTRYTQKGHAQYNAWQKAGFPEPAPEKFETEEYVCHSNVTDGQIQFHSDCTHHLKGQRVPLTEMPV